MTNDNEIEKLKDEIENYLKINTFDDFCLNIENDMKKFQNYPIDIKEFSRCISKEHKYIDRMNKLKQKIDIITLQNENALKNIEKSKIKIKDLKEHISKLENEVENKKKMIEKIDDTCDFIGLQIYNVSESLYNVKLSKLPIKNYDLVFSFDIFYNGDTTELKKIDPDNCIDVDKIMSEINMIEDDKKFLKLIVMIRQQLIEKYS